MALVLKKKGEVKYKPFSSQDSNSDLEISKPLFNQDQILTGTDGFTKVVYLDDGSTIKVHRDSEVYIQGSIKNRRIIKQINIAQGKMKFDINPQKSTDFRVVTPTSVASIKGTRFWVDCRGEEGDSFIGLTGKVEVENIESGQIVQLESNTTINSLPDGSINIIPTKPLELQILEQMEEEVGETTEEEINNATSPAQSPTQQTQPSTSPTNSGQSTPIEHELKIKLINASGDEKELIIKYSE
ncbi:MAG: FecR domain-containing protein [Candidatus Marinimicrobia bacterium]|nr:FecR domain-containing protein [Candidatus Neomarinimicrobiota bacterium]